MILFHWLQMRRKGEGRYTIVLFIMSLAQIQMWNMTMMITVIVVDVAVRLDVLNKKERKSRLTSVEPAWKKTPAPRMT